MAMDHKAFLAALTPEDLAGLTRRSDRAGLLRLAGHIGAILVGGTWIATGAPLWWLVVPVHGVLICFLFTLEHEATHQTPFANRTLNEAVGRAVGVVICLPFEWFRCFHLAHHRHTNIPGRDPELAPGAKPETWLDFLIYVSGYRYWSGMVRQLAANASGADPGGFVPPKARRRVVVEARWMLLLPLLANHPPLDEAVDLRVEKRSVATKATKTM